MGAPINPNNTALNAAIKRQAKRRKAQRRRRAERRAANQCVRCKLPVEIDRVGLNHCQSCHNKGLKNSYSWRARRTKAWKELGLCTHCFGKRLSMPGTFSCAYCAEKDYETKCARIAQAKDAGICARCFDPEAVHGYFKSTGNRKKYCIACLDKYNNAKRRHHPRRAA